jgi:hypothetical protein
MEQNFVNEKEAPSNRFLDEVKVQKKKDAIEIMKMREEYAKAKNLTKE